MDVAEMIGRRQFITANGKAEKIGYPKSSKLTRNWLNFEWMLPLLWDLLELISLLGNWMFNLVKIWAKSPFTSKLLPVAEIGYPKWSKLTRFWMDFAVVMGFVGIDFTFRKLDV